MPDKWAVARCPEQGRKEAPRLDECPIAFPRYPFIPIDIPNELPIKTGSKRPDDDITGLSVSGAILAAAARSGVPDSFQFTGEERAWLDDG